MRAPTKTDFDSVGVISLLAGGYGELHRRRAILAVQHSHVHSRFRFAIESKMKKAQRGIGSECLVHFWMQ
jgi:hypothetical protein